MSTPTTRPAIWSAIRTLHWQGADITAPRVRALLTGADPGSITRIRDYLHALAAAGILGEHPDAEPRGCYRLLRDTGHEAPRVRADGTQAVLGLGRERMWAVMRVLRRGFTVTDLAVHASVDDHVVSEAEARDYCQRLRRAGYLVRVEVGFYRLIPSRWRGPQPPQVRRDKTILDPNTGTVYDKAGREVTP